MDLTVDEYQQEIAAALRRYDLFIVCVEKTPEQFLEILRSLVAKAISAYENRAPGLRHGISLDRHVTVILSESDGARPVCGIYFNLHSPYTKKLAEVSK